jgi:hypothetical protein
MARRVEFAFLQIGVKGLENIENVGPKLAQVLEALIG